MRLGLTALFSLAVLSAGCDMKPWGSDAASFPRPDRPVSAKGTYEVSSETQRDNRGEAQTVMDLAGLQQGMTVADIGAGDGYYTVRLADRVGKRGRVLAQDIDGNAVTGLARRVEREGLENVSIRRGEQADPKLPAASFDRVFMVHMYHEIEQPYEFLWRLWPALRKGGQVVVVDIDKSTGQHGIDPLLLSCEFERVGYELVEFKDAPELLGYYAQFKAAARRPEPGDIKPCRSDKAARGTAQPAPPPKREKA